MTNFDIFGATPPSGKWGVNFGGGDNSTALLLTLHDRGVRPDFVVFSDTGSERPSTYLNVQRVGDWCVSVGFPFDTTRWIRKDGSFEPLHENCLRTEYLPSKAYGYSGCTYKWKIQPLQKWRKAHGFTPTTVAIAYDAGEKIRLARAAKTACEDVERDSDETFWYPLVGYEMDRAACVARIELQGWPTGKSACFMCPNMRPAEWEDLRKTDPDLFQIAVNIQDRADAAGHATTKNLFRSFDPKNSGCLCTADRCESSASSASGVDPLPHARAEKE